MVNGINGNYTYTSNNTLGSLFSDPFFIGFGRELSRINDVFNMATKQSYPPYDLIKLDEDTYKLLSSLRKSRNTLIEIFCAGAENISNDHKYS